MVIVCRVLITTDKSCISRSICQFIYFLDYLIPSKLGQHPDPNPVVETATLTEEKLSLEEPSQKEYRPAVDRYQPRNNCSGRQHLLQYVQNYHLTWHTKRTRLHGQVLVGPCTARLERGTSMTQMKQTYHGKTRRSMDEIR
jgi:hypothetical protein